MKLVDKFLFVDINKYLRNKHQRKQSTTMASHFRYWYVTVMITICQNSQIKMFSFIRTVVVLKRFKNNNKQKQQ